MSVRVVLFGILLSGLLPAAKRPIAFCPGDAKYPAKALRAGSETSIPVEVVVAPDGSVESATVTNIASNDVDFVKTARDHAKRIKFKPSTTRSTLEVVDLWYKFVIDPEVKSGTTMIERDSITDSSLHIITFRASPMPIAGRRPQKSFANAVH